MALVASALFLEYCSPANAVCICAGSLTIDVRHKEAQVRAVERIAPLVNRDLDRVALVGRRILDGFGVRFGRRKRADRQAERQHQRRPTDDFLINDSFGHAWRCRFFKVGASACPHKQLGLNRRIKKFSYSFICGRAILPPSGRIALSTVCGSFKAGALWIWYLGEAGAEPHRFPYCAVNMMTSLTERSLPPEGMLMTSPRK